jgi:hypothetical protein
VTGGQEVAFGKGFGGSEEGKEKKRKRARNQDPIHVFHQPRTYFSFFVITVIIHAPLLPPSNTLQTARKRKG